MTGTLDQTAVFSTTPRMLNLQTRLRAFMDEQIYPNEAEFDPAGQRGKPLGARPTDRRPEAQSA